MDDMPQVQHCEALDCFYNGAHHCHAPAINIGEHPHVLGHHHEALHAPEEEHHAEPHTPGHHEHCITYQPEARHIQRTQEGQVGACHVSGCRWNTELQCEAPGIVVSPHEHHADCSTYAPRAAA